MGELIRPIRTNFTECGYTEDMKVFQAVGLLKGRFEQNDSWWDLVVDEKHRYKISFTCTAWRTFQKKLKNQPEELKGSLYVWCYPRCKIIPKETHQLTFEVVAWNSTRTWGMENHFVIRGIWQMIPQVRGTVLSIYRNKTAKDRKKLFKVVHVPIPILMTRKDGISPYRFSPPVEGKKSAPRFFIEAIFRFIPEKNTFGFLKDLARPISDIPTHRTPARTKQRRLERKERYARENDGSIANNKKSVSEQLRKE